MTSLRKRFFILGAAGACALSASSSAQAPAADAPRYESGTELVRPEDYRSWPFIGAGLGMTYDGERGTQAGGDNPRFTQTFVNPTAYQHFVRTGTWPDGTIFMLEFRASQSEGSINRSGRFATHLTLLEAEVKDSRFPDGWAYFVFGAGDQLAAKAKPLDAAGAASCVECHTEHGAVERTFVQFYPHLLEIARAKGTLKPGF